ncbi:MULTISPECIES: glycerol-3-phosphate cytidylyltransferase [Paracoccus]|jgi:glycerol-3-phosphate cytidylyltransferase|uniref:Glycerol-3-phosphate cytidylyltransferase n=1 Tax=Paracoccus denitrificans (strain Pd 1222) TaxID=318586 RepID=A1BC41_PARDP|nr:MULTISPECIES: glycerol-3-phosphate cytidylyltransferase [Paracoccus]ABL73085.1 Glycerol-3-phosphate cytidylyltransferase [Paracoccus denitrificans PD1222]MBB4628460.1 glycerol-3-phosphate cytidylyltransferase [Paracoccus denitrificans]MCU7431134.1 glycerol-3-phosphate cytidylyltransferase [Paracoccus denitrificans]MDK8873836.1 glycerol-3-phosphate cytidylyltransferase [Paracoccus sp. SSJ]QAR29474.1 glycerol-3-phosphate cytidylyltransferase [Paracoccus denitrificans]
MRRVLTYGTFDTLHYGHIRLLQRARALGDYLIVGLSTDEFNASKNKQAFHSWEERKAHLEALRYVDLVIPERTWEQKPHDVKLYHVDIFTMGSDWQGKFDDLSALCEVIYLERTNGISSTMIRSSLQPDEPSSTSPAAILKRAR